MELWREGKSERERKGEREGEKGRERRGEREGERGGRERDRGRKKEERE